MTPAVTDVEQAERSDLLVLRCMHMAAAAPGSDAEEVRDLLVLCHGMANDEAERAIGNALAHGLVRLSPG